MSNFARRFTKLREPFGTAGFIISIVALVAALGGGAYAATGGSGGGKATASKAGKRGPKGPKGATGPAGPTGPVGPKGDPGAPGAAGTNGTNGTPGTPGQSVTSVAEPPGANCEEGGYKLTSASGTSFVCNGEAGEEGEPGKEGEPWVAGTAPSDVVMKGTWAAHSSNAAAGEEFPIALSFTVPVVAAELGIAFIPPGNPNEYPLCTGTADNPTPAEFEGSHIPGTICVYEKAGTNVGEEYLTLLSSPGGAVGSIKAKNSGLFSAYGSWAMYTP